MEALRTCRTCGLEAHTEADLELFRTQNTKPYGKDNLCKRCRNASLRKPPKPYLRKCRVCGLEATNETELSLFRVKTANPYGRANLCLTCWRKQNRKGGKFYDYHLQKKREDNATPEGRKRNIAGNLARLAHPELVCCENCGSTENLHRHHPDYDKPLEIMVLCEPCHKEVHRK